MQIVGDEPVPPVEKQNVEFLHLTMTGERAAVVDDLGIVAEGRADGFRHVGPGPADAEGLGGLDGGDRILGEAGNGTEAVGPGGEDARRGAEDVRQCPSSD